MTFLAPWALWFSAVGAAVVALYLLKIKRRRQLVPALDFWRELAGQTRVRSLFQQLKRWLSLLLWLIIVTCLVFALGNPVLSFGRIKPRSIAVILDNSASMQTVEAAHDGQTRLALAIDALHELLAGRPVADEWLLIEAARAPRVLHGWTRDKKAVREAALALAPRAGSADVAATVELARQLLEGRERPTIVLVSDGAGRAAEALVPDQDSEVFWPIGETRDNLGIVRLAVRADRRQAAHLVYIRLVNASDKPVETQVVLELDGQTTAVEPVAIEPESSWEKTVALNAPQGGVLRAWIDRPDALAADNEAFAILEPLRAARVLLVAPADEAFFFVQALAAMDPLVDIDASRTVSDLDYDALPREERDFDLTIFTNCRPAELPARGAFVLVNAWPDELPLRQTGELEAPRLSLARRDHPLMQHLSINAAMLARARRVELTEPAEVLARSLDGSPLIFLFEQPNRRVLTLAFDVLDSDLPFRNAFPLLLRNVVTYLVTERSAWLRGQHQVGETVEPLRPLPQGVSEVSITRLVGDQQIETTLAVRGGSFTYEGTDVCGPLRFTIGEDIAYTAVNLTDSRESRIAPAAAARPPNELLSLSRSLLGAAPWLALVVVVTVLVAFEWLTYHLRWTE